MLNTASRPERAEGTSVCPHALKVQKEQVFAPLALKGQKEQVFAPLALKGQKLLAQGIALGNVGNQQSAL